MGRQKERKNVKWRETSEEESREWVMFKYLVWVILVPLPGLCMTNSHLYRHYVQLAAQTGIDIYFMLQLKKWNLSNGKLWVLH